MKSKRRRFGQILIFAVLLTVLAFVSGGCAADTYTVCSSGCNYTRIQDAINASQPGDAIEVQSGTYYENVDVYKQLILRGLDTGSGKPIVDAGSTGSAITLSHDGIVLDGFTVTNASGYSQPGILVVSNNNIVINNTANLNNETGILLWFSNNNTLTSNTANSNNNYGIHLSYSSNNTLAGNTANSNNWHGFYIHESSTTNTLAGNIANSNNRYGIRLASSSNNTLTGNTASNNKFGIFVGSSNNNTLTNNVANSNIDGGISLVDSSNNNHIYNNYFDNSINAFDDGNNTWNITKTAGTNIISGPNLGGNYWSDYTGEDTDGDGLGDTLLPYNSSGNIVNGGDWLPLVKAGNQPPTFNFTFANTCCFNVTFTGMGVDSDGTIVNHTWDFGDGSTSGVIAGAPGVITHHYTTCGPKLVKLSGYDNDGNWNFTQKPIYVDCGPTANAVALPSACYDYNGSMITFDGSASHADLSNTRDPRTITYSWTFSDGLTGDNDNGAITKRMVNETITATLTVSDGHCEDTSYIHIVPGFVPIFDTGEGSYPSISGTFTGTITPSQNLTVGTLYTYNCKGTGGHTKSIEFYEDSTLLANGMWSGYAGDWHNVTFNGVTLLKDHEYRYVIVTGSYPQIIHASSYNATGGVITCSEFVDINGKQHEGWIPAVRLE